MDFEFPENAEEFRTELREFLEKELPPWWTQLFDEDERIIPFTVEFCKKLASRGWLTMAWPSTPVSAAARRHAGTTACRT